MRRLGRLRALAVVTAAAGLVGLTAVSAPGQPAPSAFEAIAAADGMRVNVVVPGAPLTANVFDGGAPVTQAVVNGIGESRALAATPYPGEAAVTLPGLILPLLGLPSPPDYPLMARSEGGTTPESTVESGGVTLTAKSDERRSEATSLSGGGSDGNSVGRIVTAAVASLDESGGVAAEATSTVESFTVAGVLRVGAATATAKAARSATGEPSSSSSFDAEGVSAAGQAIGVNGEGILLPGQTAPVPDTSGLSPVLDGAGITLRYLAPREIQDGVISAGLAIEVPLTVPGRAPATVSYVLGQARATAISAGDASGEATVDDLDVGGDVVAPDAGGSGDVSTGGVDPVSTGDGVGFSASPPSDAPAFDGGSSPVPAASDGGGGSSVASGAPSTATRPVSATGPPGGSAAAFYLVLVVGAVVALTGGVLVRTIGVKLAWTS